MDEVVGMRGHAWVCTAVDEGARMCTMQQGWHGCASHEWWHGMRGMHRGTGRRGRGCVHAEAVDEGSGVRKGSREWPRGQARPRRDGHGVACMGIHSHGWTGMRARRVRTRA